MIDHHVSKFFEILFWIGAALIFVSFFYPRWFMVTIAVGVLLMIIATVREGFGLRRAKTIVGVIKKNEPKVLHRIILLIVVITVFIYLLLKQIQVYNFMIQLYDLTKSPASITWWVFVLIGIIIGILILFFAIKIWQIEYKKFITWSSLKIKTLEKTPMAKIKEKAVAKTVTAKIKPGLFTKLTLEEKSFWRNTIAWLSKKLEKEKPKK